MERLNEEEEVAEAAVDPPEAREEELPVVEVARRE